jgi:signal transduction histidine kinase
MMPALDGYGVLLELRDEPATSLIPFIFMTAKSGRDYLRRGMVMGANDYLTKPFTSDELLEAINTQLEKQASIASKYEQQLDDLRLSLVHTMPHEFRTPLSVIMGYAYLLHMDYDTVQRDSLRKMTELIIKSGERLTRLIENYLLYSQLEILRIDPEKTVSLKGELARPGAVVANAARLKAEEYQREDDLDIETNDVLVPISEDNLKRIAEELIDNAFKFSQAGTTVKVTALPGEDTFTFRVSDNGRGMSAEQIKNLGAYVQFARQLYEQQGSGLGFIIAKRLVELHGGQLTIKSAPERGTHIYVSFPVQSKLQPELKPTRADNAG